LGRPGERLATPGSARVYLDEDSWQAEVITELQTAQAIILQPGATVGVRWELEHVRDLVEPYRVLLCMVSFWRNPQAFEEVSCLLRSAFRSEMPRVIPFLERPAFVYFDRGWVPQLQELSYQCPALWPLTSDAADLQYSLYPFLEGLHGGEREPPR